MSSQTSLPPDLLDGLDDALVRVRRVLQSPSYRRRLMDRLGGDDPLSTLRLVRAVERAGSPPSVGDVAEMLLVDPSTASRSVDDAVDRGYLERRPCDRDRRRALLHLTPSGRRLLQRMASARRALLSEVITDWSEEELADLVERLRHLLDGLNRVRSAP
jgi:DNA-binding MarR family transcriptional regulator